MTSLGYTRSCHKPNHLLQTPDTFIRAPLPDMKKCTAIVHAAPAIGAGFIQYTAEMEAGGSLLSNGCQRFVYVIDGSAQVEYEERSENLLPGAYCYLPPAKNHRISTITGSRLLAIEKPYLPVNDMEAPAFFAADSESINATPLMGDSEVRVQVLIPEKPEFDFAVNLMTFEPGASLALVEVHVMEHGLLLLDGGGIYRLGDCWHSVASGDFIWMAPYCPQWFGAIGKKAARYLLYKDWNRRPESHR